MDDKSSEVGTALPNKSPTLPSTDQLAKDQEFALFYKAETPRLVAFLMNHGAHAAVAADLTQETMILLYRSWDSIDSPRAWIRTVASRLWWRAVEQAANEVATDPATQPNPLLDDEEAAEIEARHAFLALTRELPMRQRQVMAWTFDGYTPTEIAGLLGMKPATVRSNLRAARETLRERLRQAEGETS